MKKFKSLFLVILVLVIGSAFLACGNDETNLFIEYEKIGVTKDATPIYYVQISMMITNEENGIEFNASDFSIVRNGVKENGLAFITETKYSENSNGTITWTSVTEPTLKIKNNNGAHLQIVFTGNDNITECFYKSQKIALA